MASKETPFSSATCQLCSGAFTDPRMLGCLHSFCKDCLKKELEKVESQSHLKCPTCKQVFSLTTGGIDSLPKNLRLSFNVEIAEYTERMESTGDIDCDACVDTSGQAVAFCSQCCEFLCESCTSYHRRARKTLKHEIITIGEKKQGGAFVDMKPHDMYCSEPDHDGEVLKFYCETCQQLVCRDCVLVKHKEHVHSDVSVVAKSHKEEMKVLEEPACGAISALVDAKGANDKMIQLVKTRVCEVHESIEKAFAELEKALQLQRNALMDSISEIGTSKVTALMLQQEEFQRCQDSLQGYIDAIEGALQTHTDKEIIALGGLLQHELQSSIRQFKNVSLSPTRGYLMCAEFPTASLCETISSFGDVSEGSCPTQATAQLHIPRAIIGRERRVKLVTRSVNGEAYKIGGEQVTGELSLMGSGHEPIFSHTTDHGDGTYTLAFTPQAIGEHSLAMTVEGNSINNSPYVISVHEASDYSSIQKPQQTYNIPTQPYCVAVHSSGDIFVTQSSNVLILHPDGSTKTTVGSGGSGECQFSAVTGISFCGDMVYIADQNNHRIQKLDITGTFMSQFGKQGSEKGQLKSPIGLTLDVNGKIYVVENGNNRVSVFGLDGSFVHTIPDDDAQKNHLTNPYGLAFDHHGNLHVVSRGTNLIVVYTPEGQFLREYGQGELTQPSGITIDEEGFSLVTEWNGSSSRLQIFNSDDQLVNTLTGFNHSFDVTLSKEGILYAADHSNKKVYKY